MRPPGWAVDRGERLDLDAFASAFSHAWARLGKRFLKAECWQSYRENGNSASQRAYERGEHDRAVELLREEAEADRPLYADVRSRGIEFARIRVLRQPLTDYFRYELPAYRIRARMGETTEVVRAEPGAPLPGDDCFDFLLFDRDTALTLGSRPVAGHGSRTKIIGPGWERPSAEGEAAQGEAVGDAARGDQRGHLREGDDAGAFEVVSAVAGGGGVEQGVVDRGGVDPHGLRGEAGAAAEHAVVAEVARAQGEGGLLGELPQRRRHGLLAGVDAAHGQFQGEFTGRVPVGVDEQQPVAVGADEQRHGVGAFHHGVAAGPVAADDLVLEQGQPGIGVDGGAGDPFGARQRCCFLPGAEVSPSPHTASRVRSTQASDWGSKSSGRIRHCRQAWATSSGWAGTTRFL